MANPWKEYKENQGLGQLKEHKRSRHSVHLCLPGGQIQAEISLTPICHNVDGPWKDIDTEDIRDDGEWWWVPGTPGKVRKADKAVGGVDGLYTQKSSRVGRLDPSDGSFTFLWDIPVGSPVGDSVVSSGPNWSHSITFDIEGITERFVIDSNPGTLGAKPGEYIVIETEVPTLLFDEGWVEEYEVGGFVFPMPRAFDADGNEIECRRYAKTVGTTQVLYTGILATSLPLAVYPLTIDPDFYPAASSGGYLLGTDTTTYSAARDTCDAHTVTTSFTLANYYAPGEYDVWRFVARYDTSSIGSSNVVQVNFNSYISSESGGTGDSNDIVWPLKYDWSANYPLAAGTREAIFDGILTATKDSNSCFEISSVDVGNYYLSGNQSTAWINGSGYTYYGFVVSGDYDNQTPTSTGAFCSGGFWLRVVYEMPSGTTRNPGNATTSCATAPYDDEDWDSPTNIFSDNNYYAYLGYEDGTPTSDTQSATDTFVTSNATSPWDDSDWSPKSGISASGGTDSDCTLSSGQYTYMMKAQGFGFSIPSTATIDGVIATYRIDADNAFLGTIRDDLVQLLGASGELIGFNQSADANWPTSYANRTEGGSSDTWGASLTPAIVNDADFGLALAPYQSGGIGSGTVHVDWIQLQVYYTPLLYTFDNGEYSCLLFANTFGFYIPSAATVTGVEVKIKRFADAGTIKDAVVQLTNASGTRVGDNKADTSTAWPGTETEKTYGSSSDDWSASLTPTIIADDDFGVAISVKAEADDSVPKIDHVTITLYWSFVASLTGQSVTSATGTIGCNKAVDLTGQSVTTTAGAFSPDREVTLSGQSATSSVGTLAVGESYDLSGQEVSSAYGTLGVDIFEGVPLVGQEVTSYQGTLVLVEAYDISGEEAATETGTIGIASSIGLVGVDASSSLGTLVPVNKQSLVGEEASSATGTITQERAVDLTGEEVATTAGSAKAGQIISGVSVTSYTGTITPGIGQDLVGQEAISYAGVISAYGNSPLTGLVVSSATGTITTKNQVSISGISVTSSAGTIGVGFGRTLSGRSVNTAGIGIIETNTNVDLTGREVTTQTGTIVGSSAAGTLTGEEVATETGTITTRINQDLSGSEVTSATGTFGSTRSVAISGISVTSIPGSVEPLAESVAAISGISVTSTPGTITTKEAYALSGIAVASVLGTLGKGKTFYLNGSWIIAYQGTLGTKTSVDLVGEEVAAETGTITSSVVFGASLTGEEVVTEEGGIVAGIGQVLVGEEVSVSHGTIGGVLGTVDSITGLEVITYTGILGTIYIPGGQERNFIGFIQQEIETLGRAAVEINTFGALSPEIDLIGEVTEYTFGD